MEEKKKKFNRRNFIKGTIGTVVAAELLYVLNGLVGKDKPATKTEDLFIAGNISSFQTEQVYPFSSGFFYLSVFEDGGLLAISIKCTHLGCMVQVNNKTNGFDCPCHASKFNKYGEVLSAPATRALDILPITILNGNVLVDINNPQKRKSFDKSQLVYIS